MENPSFSPRGSWNSAGFSLASEGGREELRELREIDINGGEFGRKEIIRKNVDRKGVRSEITRFLERRENRRACVFWYMYMFSNNLKESA